MASKKISASSHSTFSGMLKKVVLVFLVGFLGWAYQSTKPPPPNKCGSNDGPPLTSPRIQLKDGRFLAYKESGVPKDDAKYKLVFVHGFDCCRHDVAAITAHLSPDIVESKGIYIVSFDRPGYGESDPNPSQTRRSISSDIEELADQLGLGSRFYVVGFSLGGQIVWTCLKYIPHRLAGAALIAPAVNYWWEGIPRNLSVEAYKKQLPQDQWAFRVAHYAPWLSYWWNTQKLFPGLSIIRYSPKVHSRQDAELIPRIRSIRQDFVKIEGQDVLQVMLEAEFFIRGFEITITYDQKHDPRQVRQQGEFESLHRDLAFGFRRWEFDPTEVKNPFPEGGGSVHLWQGDEDRLVPATLQRHIAQRLPWIEYHEVAGADHKFLYAHGIADSIIQALLS